MGFQPIGRISPVAPVPSLVTSARRLPDGTDWHSGIAWATGCQPSIQEAFCPDSPTSRVSPDAGDIVHAMPFLIYTPYECEVQTVDLTDGPRMVEELTDVHTARALAAALWMGEGLDADDEDQVTLRRHAEALDQAAAVDLDDGVGALLGRYEECTGGSGGALIHLPVTLTPFALGGGSGGARVCWPEGNIYRGPASSVVVPGPGYPLGASAAGPGGYGPETSPGQYAGNSASESWVYISGPVEYDVTPIEALPAAEQDRFVFRTNLYQVWGQRNAIVRFDPCCTFAVKVNNPVPATEVS